MKQLGKAVVGSTLLSLSLAHVLVTDSVAAELKAVCASFAQRPSVEQCAIESGEDPAMQHVGCSTHPGASAVFYSQGLGDEKDTLTHRGHKEADTPALEWRLLPRDASEWDVEFDELDEESGAKRRPRVSAEGLDLVEGVDYELAYSYDEEIETMTVVVKGINSFRGRQVTSYHVLGMSV